MLGFNDYMAFWGEENSESSPLILTNFLSPLMPGCMCPAPLGTPYSAIPYCLCDLLSLGAQLVTMKAQSSADSRWFYLIRSA